MITFFAGTSIHPTQGLKYRRRALLPQARDIQEKNVTENIFSPLKVKRHRNKNETMVCSGIFS